MKNHILIAVVGIALILSGFGPGFNALAQSKGQRGSGSQAKVDLAKGTPSDEKLANIQQIVRDRAAGRLAPGGSCQTADPILLDVTINDSLTTTDCQLQDNSFIDFYDFSGKAGQAISISETSAVFDTYLYLLDDGGVIIDQNDDASAATTSSRIPSANGVMTLPYTGHYVLGANSFDKLTTGAYSVSVNSDAGCAVTKVGYNQTINGTLANTDCAVKFNNQPYYTDLITFDGTAGQEISITMSATPADAYLVLHTPSGEASLNDDDSGGGSNARIPATGSLVLPQTGTYTIEATSFTMGQTGSYTLSLTGVNLPPVTVTGQVMSPDGRGLKNAAVTLVDEQNLRYSSLTSSFGYFSFVGVPAGKTYTLAVSSKRYRYTARPVHIDNNVKVDDFVGVE